MILLFKYILLSSLLISTLHGQRKGKRDLADLSNDPVLSSIFSSDVKEERPDRSTSLQEDILTNKHEKSKNEQLASILFPDRYQQRRDTDPVSELMSLNKNVKAVKKTLKPNLLENNIKNTVPGQTDNNIKNVKPLISESLSVVEPIASKFNTPIRKQNMMEQQLAVNPALFASNYLPLPGSNYPEQHNSMPVTKKDTIVYPQTNPMVIGMSMDQNNNKKSIIPPSSFVTSDVKPPKIDSFPVQLRVHSPNMKLRGVVPHITEYGETVQSVQEFRRMVSYKKNTIPQPMYSNEIYKKNDIPQPPSSHKATIKKHKQEKGSKTSKSKSVKKSTSSTKKSMTKKQQKVKSTKESNREQKRQYLPQPYAPQQLIPQNQQSIAQNQYYQPSVANYQQQNPFSIQQSALEFKAPQVQQNAAQVQNMDGLFARPIITEEACADQYASCVDFAKNNYCMNYPDLMKIQCRKSCSYCVPPASSSVNSTSQNANATVDSGDETQDSDSGDSDSGSGSGSGSEDWKASAVRTITAIGNKRHDVLQERVHNQGINSGSGNSDESGRGSEESGSTSNDDDENKVLIPVVNNITTSNTNNARNKISFPKILRKIDLGDFVLPVKKSEIPMLPLHVIAAHLNHADTSDLDDASNSGSGSGSGDSGDESDSESGESEAPKKSVVTKESTHYSKIKASPTAKKSMPAKPSLPGAYPKIDLRAIASALANYEEAALQLAGEYPKAASVDITDYTRSIIPHPENKEQIKLNKLKQNIQIAKLLTEERIRKGTIPKFLKLTKDAIKSKEDEKDPLEADSVDSVQQRFIIPEMEPTLNDYYAETGRMNPYEKKKKTVKKSRIEAMQKIISEDPYEYLRNMPAGASMEPIVDPQARSTIPSDHSYPVFLMKVSPADEKYLPESPARRGMVRKLDAEGLPVKPAVVAPKPAEIAPSSFVPYETPEPKPVPVRQPLPPALFEAPQAPPQEQAQIFQPPINYNNIEQESAPRASAAFANEESVGVPEKQPGTGSLRSKMLSAFFSVKNDGLEEGSGGGSGYGITNEPEVGMRQTVWPGGFKK